MNGRAGLKIGVFLTVGLCLAASFSPLPVRAERLAPPITPTPPAGTQVVPGSTLILRIQQALGEQGLYFGPLDGRMGPMTRDAIRAYQRRERLAVDGEATEALANRLETRAKIEDLLGGLEEARKREAERARQALLANPATRHLASEAAPEPADPTRDFSACLTAPTPKCLLDEAVQSALAEVKDERRDWAFGEILAAQAKAGLLSDAMTTVGHIRDLRLVIVALVSIAKAEAQAGRDEGALAAARLITIPERKAEALVSIAETMGARPRPGGDQALAAEALALTRAELPLIEDISTRIILMCRLGLVDWTAGRHEAGFALVEEAMALANGPDETSRRDAALRQVATTLADMNRADEALNMLDQIEGENERMAILVAAARSLARAGSADAALDAASRVGEARYRAVVLAGIAQTIAQTIGETRTQVKDILDRARMTASQINLPFARSFAMNRIVAAEIEIGAYAEAATTADGIDDRKLRAQALWTIAALQRRNGDGDGAALTSSAAEKATDEVFGDLDRAWMFADLTLARIIADDLEAAHFAFTRGLEAGGRLTYPFARARALAKLADALDELRRADRGRP